MPPRSRSDSDSDSGVLDKVQDKDESKGTSEGTADEQEGESAKLEARVGAGGHDAAAGLRIPLPAALVPNGTDAKRLLWLGGLGALAVVGVLEWPVALAVGAGSLVAERLAREPRPQAPAGSPSTPETSPKP
jgi:hypothetical protein